MWSTTVVETDVYGKLGFRLADRAIRVQVNVLVLDGLPQSLDKHIGVSSQLRRLATIRADVSG